MACCHHYLPSEGREDAFTAQMPLVTFGRGVLAEVGDRAAARGFRRVALMTDATLAGLPPVATVGDALARAGLDHAVYDETLVEPTGGSVQAAARFLAEGSFDAIVSVGGGSVIDTAKAASLHALHPADELAYVAAPAGGGGRPIEGPLHPHIACPTTSGTGSECTPLTVVEFDQIGTKVPLMSRHFMPVEAVVDPTCAYSLPRSVVAASAFDLLSHALEGFTARQHTRYPRPASGPQRLPIQGANPWSDLYCREALRLAGLYLERSLADAKDREARDNMAWAATLAGIGFGNTGTHAPHAMAYPVAALNRDFRVEGYPGKPMVPHGYGVIVNSPSVFRFTAQATPERHLEAADHLGAETRGATPADAGEVLAGRLIALMKAAGMPNGIGGIGYTAKDVSALAERVRFQRRALGNAPRDIDVDGEDMHRLYEGALAYW